MTARNDVTYITARSSGSESKERRTSARLSALSVAIPSANRRAIRRIGIIEFFDRSGFDKVLGYVTFEPAGEIDWRADDLVGGFP